MSSFAELGEASRSVRRRMPPGFHPALSLVTGSGLGGLLNSVKRHVTLSYADLPGFARTRVSGHDGQLCLGKLAHKDIVVFSGRVHYYEGHSLEQVIFPVRLAAALGAAVGAIYR